MRLRRFNMAEASVILLVATLLISVYALWVQQQRASAVVLARAVENASVM